MKKFAFEKKLFWDVNIKELDYRIHRQFIVDRILNYGDEQDYHALKKIYDSKALISAARNGHYINQKNIHFWGLVFRIPIAQFRCMKKSSIQKPGAFFKR